MTLRSRQRVAIFVGIHLLISGVVAAALVRQFSQGWRAIAAHILVLAEWDALLLVVLGTFVAFQPPRARLWACRLLPAATFACQIYLYALNIVSNMFWGRNITGHLVAAFAPTVWSGKEPFPVGAAGIGLFAFGTMALMTARRDGGARRSTTACGRGCRTRMAPAGQKPILRRDGRRRDRVRRHRLRRHDGLGRSADRQSVLEAANWSPASSGPTALPSSRRLDATRSPNATPSCGPRTRGT